MLRLMIMLQNMNPNKEKNDRVAIIVKNLYFSSRTMQAMLFLYHVKMLIPGPRPTHSILSSLVSITNNCTVVFMVSLNEGKTKEKHYIYPNDSQHERIKVLHDVFNGFLTYNKAGLTVRKMSEYQQ